jgi:hypothetical protein
MSDRLPSPPPCKRGRSRECGCHGAVYSSLTSAFRVWVSGLGVAQSIGAQPVLVMRGPFGLAAAVPPEQRLGDQ